MCIRDSLIDDEADNASINTKDKENPTAINAAIRKLLILFSKANYVGFTATPYANIFIDPETYNKMVVGDLFPCLLYTSGWRVQKSA